MSKKGKLEADELGNLIPWILFLIVIGYAVYYVINRLIS